MLCRTFLLVNVLLILVTLTPSSAFLNTPVFRGRSNSKRMAAQSNTSPDRATHVEAIAGATALGDTHLIIPNHAQGYDLHGVLTVKDAESKYLWILCHGLCSSSLGSVPRFISSMLEANTLR